MKYLIAGLGNIGDEYANTRHNIGFVVMDAIARVTGVDFSPGRHADVATAVYKARTLILIKPTTYVNLSGKAVRYWTTKEKIDLSRLLVIVDDIALPLGTLRLKARGSDGGHNGLADVIGYLETTDFARLRIGIGGDFARGYQVDYVLGKWTKQEEEILLPCIPVAVEAVMSFVTIGVDRTMNEYNTR
jgi:PTH1 family peptidyl-tRNA hydrolase